MDRQYEPIGRFLQRVRARLRALSALDAAARVALALSAVVAVALTVWSLASLGGRSPIALTSLLGVVLVLAAVALAWGLLPLRGAPTDAQVARFIEERVPALDDRLATAVDIVQRDDTLAAGRTARRGRGPPRGCDRRRHKSCRARRSARAGFKAACGRSSRCLSWP